MADNYKANIPVEELKLNNGDVVVFYKFLTTGESRELQRMLLDGGKFNVEVGKLDNLAPSVILDVQDKSAGFLIKEIRHKEGNIEPFSAEWLKDLPIEYGNQVYEYINKISQESQLAPKEKKD